MWLGACYLGGPTETEARSGSTSRLQHRLVVSTCRPLYLVSASTWIPQPMAQNCISRLITHIYLSIYLCLCFRRALSLCKAGVGTALVGCVGSRPQANQRWLPLASPVPTKPHKGE